MLVAKKYIFTLLLSILSFSSWSQIDPVIFNIENLSAEVGDEVCIDITVENFENVASLGWINVFDINVLRFTRLDLTTSVLNENGANLLGENLFNTMTAIDGVIRVIWFDQNIVGVSIPDDGILYSICFEVIGEPCDEGLFTIAPLDDVTITLEITLPDSGTRLLTDEEIIINDGGVTVDPSGLGISSSFCSSDDNSPSGSITFAGSGGTAPYSWTFTGSGVNLMNAPGEELEDCETETISDLAPGTYTVAYTDANNVTIVDVITIQANSDFPFTAVLDITDPRCFDKNNGEISVATVNGGEAPFNYAWSTFQFTDTADDLFAGDYSVTVTDVNGCTTSASATLTADTVVANVVVLAGPSCNGASDGLVSVFASGGTPYPNGGYDFDIDGVAPTFYIANANMQGSPWTGANFPAGCFEASVTDDLNCQSDPVEFCIDEGTFSTMTIEMDSASCFGVCDGQVTITAAVVGNFAFFVTDDTGAPISGISTNVTYQSTSLCAGVYDVVVTDVNDGCMVDTMFTIGEPDLLELIVIDTIGPGCGGGDGLAQFDATGGSPPYSYLWGDAFDEPTRTGMSGGPYSVTVTDSNGCQDSLMWVFADGGDIGLSAGVLQAVTCESANDGEVRATVSVAGAFTFSWEDDNGMSLGDGDIKTGLSGGIYYVTATDGMCTDVDSVILAPGQTPSATVVMVSPSCPDIADGMLTATLADGVAPATFEWTEPPSTVVLSAGAVLLDGIGQYNLHITDANGCESDQLFDITAGPDGLTVDVINLVTNPCFGSCEGQATFVASGGPSGTGSYTFFVNGTPIVAVGGMATVTDLCAGENLVSVTDGICRTTELMFVIEDADEIFIDSLASMIVPPSCDGGDDGSITVAVGGGNSSNYDLLWINENITGPTLMGLSAGQYILQITDGIGCVVRDTIDLQTPDPLMVSINPFTTTNLSCFSGSMGRIGLLTSGGNAGTLTYDWTPMVSNTDLAVDLGPGLYSVTVTDSRGCTDDTSFELTSAPPIIAVVDTPEPPNCFGETTCISIASVTGGSGNNFTYTINNGPRLDIDTCFTVFAGPYLVTVFDSAGCAVDTMITIDQPSQPFVDAGEDQTIDLGTMTDPISASIISEVDIDSILWTPIETVECNTMDCQVVTLSPTETTSYTVTIIDENGCMTSDDLLVTVDLARNVFIPNIFSPNGDNVNDFFQLAVGNGVTTVSYLNIYDRWGSLMFTDESFMPDDMVHRGWDGTKGGTLIEPGVYVFIAEVQFVDGQRVVYKGDVTVVR